MGLTVIAGVVSTVLFATSHVPMLLKAGRTRDMTSYSIGNLILSNVANAVHSIYVFSLPFGPIWFLHGFYLMAAALMLVWFVRFDERRTKPARAELPTPFKSAGFHPPADVKAGPLVCTHDFARSRR